MNLLLFVIKNIFFIRIVSFGSPESCSPSITALKHNFPNYTFRDCVNFKKQFLKENFNLDSVLAIVGEGVGVVKYLPGLVNIRIIWNSYYP